MSMSPADQAALQARLSRAVHAHWVAFLIEGIVLLVVGALAVVVPPLATIGVTIVLGWLLLLSGVMGLVATFWLRHAPGFWWSLLSGVLGIAVGAMLLVYPVSGAISLTLVLVFFFIVEGVASIMFALDHRRQFSGRWAWMLMSGLVDIVLAAIVLVGLPGTAAWAIGLLVGINMIFGGIALIAMAMQARRGPVMPPLRV